MSHLLRKPTGTHGKVHDITAQSAGWSYVGFGLYRLQAGESAAEVTGDREVILVLVWLHVVAVGFYLFVKGDNLIFPMLTGKKKRAHVPEGWTIKLVHPLIALLVLIAAAGLVFWLTV